MVYENIYDKSEKKRNELVHWLRGSKNCSTVFEWLFERYANEILIAGGNFTLKSLTDKKEYSFNLNPGQYKPAPADYSASMAGYFSSHFFQITRNYHHPVNANVIRNHCNRLNLPNPQALKLIFVVPKGMGDYKKQKIFVDQRDSKSILSDVSAITGIGRSGTNELYSRNIKTVLDLKNSIENPNINQSKEGKEL